VKVEDAQILARVCMRKPAYLLQYIRYLYVRA